MHVETLAEGVALVCADCREVLASLRSAGVARPLDAAGLRRFPAAGTDDIVSQGELPSTVDAVITDPPYGVNLDGKRGHYRNERSAQRGDTYTSYEDTPENFKKIVVPAVSDALALAKRGLVFMAARNVQLLPLGELGGIFMPNGCGMCSWGFQNFMHCVFYGADPFLETGRVSHPNGKYGLYGNDSNRIDHPCAKPVDAMLWAVGRASLAGELVLDPFMGSGTTGIAAVKLGRRFLGIEIDEQYFSTACRRIQAALDAPDMFIEKPKPFKQEALL